MLNSACCSFSGRTDFTIVLSLRRDWEQLQGLLNGPASQGKAVLTNKKPGLLQLADHVAQLIAENKTIVTEVGNGGANYIELLTCC
jgi:hypothetical protein